MSIEPIGTNFSEIVIKYKTFHSQKCTQNINCEIAVILTTGRWFNSLAPRDTMSHGRIWVNIGSGNSLVSDSTKPLPDQMLMFH